MSRPFLIRFFAWAAVIELVVATAVLPLLASGFGAAVAGEFLYLAPIPVAAFCAYWCARISRGAERRFWLFSGFAFTLMMASESWWTYHVLFVDPAGVPLPNWFEVLQAAAAVSFLVMLVSLTEFGTDPLPTRLRVYLEILSVCIVLFVAAYMGWTAGLVHATPGGTEAVAWIAAIYPVVGLAMLIGILAVMWRRRGAWRPWQVLVTLAIVIYSLGLMTWPLWYVEFLTAPKPVSGGLFATVATFGFGLLVMAGVYRLTAEEEPAAFVTRRFPRAATAWGAAAFAVALGAAVVIMAVIGAQAHDAYGKRVIWTATLCLAGLVALRSLVQAVERAAERRRATIDPVTGLPTFSAFRHRLEAAVRDALYDETPLTLTCFDIDGFKRINLAHGHDVGDSVLKQVACVLSASLAGRAQLFRAGRDVFVAVAPRTSGVEALGYARVAVAAVDREIHVGGFAVPVSAGIAVLPEDARTAEDLVESASAALAQTKTAGTHIVRFEKSVVSTDDTEHRLAMARSRAHIAAVRALALAVEQREAAGTAHGRAVADLSRRFGEVLGMDTDEVAQLELGALVHDVGKVGIPDRVLSNRGALTDTERKSVEEHAILGERILAAAGMPGVASWIRSHHERWDGQGYPDGLRGEEIPLQARILMIVGSFEAMTDANSWREAVSVDDAIAELRLCAGTQFDPHLVEVFARLVEGMQTAPAPIALERLGIQSS
ncbi:MAG: diguanylate cyclase [Coriobacteriales bacterium]|nr:diguanylate cyclase [Coriobacteriales bacterium]